VADHHWTVTGTACPASRSADSTTFWHTESVSFLLCSYFLAISITAIKASC
jgi:Zn ribbon nucleic-acid-binding protein